MTTRNPIRRSLRKLALPLVVGGAVIAITALLVWWFLRPGEPGVTIGVEGRYQADLPGESLHAVPYTHGDALAVRIATTTKIAGGFRYDIRYMAYGPGEHDISRYLIDSNGRQLAGLPPMVVSVDALLADDESGELFDSAETPVVLSSNYYLLLTLAWILWGLLLVPLVLHGRKPRRRTVAEPPPPSVPDRLRELLEAAERRPLSVEQQADLEKLLLNYWAERLGVASGRLVDTLQQLRGDAAAGPQLQIVERWLHQRQSAANGSAARELLAELGWSAGGSRLGRKA